MTRAALTTNLELLEREAALAQVGELLEHLRAGDGSVTVVESPPGRGKTALLAAATAIASRQKMRVLQARGGELERDFAFGIARQLFERPVSQASEALRREILDGPAQQAARLLGMDRPEIPAPESIQAVVHGLYWVVLNMCSSEPLLLVIDDVHWADAPSWDWLRYLARRTGTAPFGLLVAGRAEVLEASEYSASDIARLADAPLITLAPLSDSGVETLVTAKLNEPLEPAFTRACQELTQGNPFLVVELAREIAANRIPPTAENIGQLDGLAPDRIGWSVRARLDRLGPEVKLIAEALAVLERASLTEVSDLAGIDGIAVAHALDQLAAHDLVAANGDFSFVHPIVRRTIYDRLAPARRAVMHHSAAEVIAGTGGSAERVASHLLNVPPDADEWLAARLLMAARHAGAEQAFGTVVTYLRRALAERLPPPLKREISGELGLVEEKLRLPQSVEHLTQAIDLTSDPVQRARLVQARARATAYSGRAREALELLEREIDRLDSAHPDLVWELELEIQGFGRTSPDTFDLANHRLQRLVEAAQQDPSFDRRLDQILVQRPCWEGTDWRESERRATESIRARPNPFAGDPEWIGQYFAAQTLGWCDRYEPALEQLHLAFEAAALQGSLTAHVLASTYRADVHLRRGAFAEAEADARAAIELIDEHRLAVPAALAFAWLITALIERGRAEEAWEVLKARGFDQAIPEENVFAMLYAARGLLYLTRQQPEEALADSLQAGRLLAQLGPGPAPCPWRSNAALAYHALGNAAEARRLAALDLELARSFGAPRTLGISLRTSALVGSEETLPGLRESVDVLTQSEACGELARSLLELGTALRRHRRPVSEIRPVLQRALDLAHRSGAVLVERRARDELIASGGRPRRASIRGVDALTPRELRVAELAASGATNRQIAQILFVAPRTIEHHLRSVYRKLTITSRDELPSKLNGATPG